MQPWQQLTAAAARPPQEQFAQERAWLPLVQRAEHWQWAMYGCPEPASRD